jgi:hypothetical protein
LVAVFSYLVIVGEIKRVELREEDGSLVEDTPPTPLATSS